MVLFLFFWVLNVGRMPRFWSRVNRQREEGRRKDISTEHLKRYLSTWQMYIRQRPFFLKKFGSIFFLLFLSFLGWGQTFSSTQTATFPGNFAFLSDTIRVSGVGNLDGVATGVISVKFDVTVANVLNLSPKLRLYVVAPDGHAAYLFDNYFTPGNHVLTVSETAAGSLNSYPTSTTVSQPTSEYLPFVDLNSLNLDLTPTGTWRLYAESDNTFSATTINSWEITFGNSATLHTGGPNTSCATAIPLIPTLPNGTFVSSSNQYNGVLLNIPGPQKEASDKDLGGSAGKLTETSIWYSFVPKCANDTISISSQHGYVESGILSGTCGSRTLKASKPEFIDATQLYTLTNYIPGTTYYVALDGDDGSLFQYQIKWFPGNCAQNTIVTASLPKATYCPSDTLSIAFASTGTFTAGNRFTAQLSDASGSFSNPYTIGYVDATAANKILGTLPSTLSAGAGYKIRVIASAPSTTGTASTAFQIQNAPSVPTSLTGKREVCAGDAAVPYSVQSVTGASRYRWHFNAATLVTSNADSSQVSASFGNSPTTVSVQAVNACGASLPYTQTIQVDPLISPSIALHASKDTVCEGDSVLFSTTPSPDFSPSSYQWKINQHDTLGNTASIWLHHLGKTPSVSVMASSNQTCLTHPMATATLVAPVVLDTVTPHVTLKGDTVFCSGNPISFLASSQHKGTSYRFVWQINHTLRPEQDSTLQLLSPQDKDTVKVMLQTTFQCARPKNVVATPLVLHTVQNLTPVIRITPPPPFCQGSTVRLTTEHSGEGSNPLYAWLKNNQPVGTNQDSYTSTDFQNGDIIEVLLTNRDACASPSPASTNTSLTVLAGQPFSVDLDVTRKGRCQGDTFSFHAVPNLTGSTQIVWKINGRTLTESSDTFTSSQLQNGDSVKVAMTNNGTCLTRSEVDTFFVVSISDTVKPHVTLLGDGMFCKGTTAQFQAESHYGGSQARFTWYLNGNKQSTIDSVFSSSALSDQDVLQVMLKSSLACARPDTVFSSTLTLSARDTVPTILILGPDSACQGSPLPFTTQLTGAGKSPAFIWVLNGQITDSAGTTFSRSTWQNNDTLSVRLISSAACAHPDTVSSVPKILHILNQTPTQFHLLGDSVYCRQPSILIATAFQGGGRQPTFSWSVDGQARQGDSSLSISGLAPGMHQVQALFTSSAECPQYASIEDNFRFRVKDSIKATLSITGDTVLCENSAGSYQLTSPLSLSNMQYHWQLDGIEVGTAPNLTLSQVSDQDRVSLLVETDETCVPHPILPSNVLTVHVTPSQVPDLRFQFSKQEICPGETETYSLFPSTSRPSDSYSWYVNGQAVLGNGTDTLSYPTSSNTQISAQFQTLLACGTYNSPVLFAPLPTFKASAPLLTGISGPSQYCPLDANLLFSTDSISGSAYTWSYPSHAKAVLEGNKIVLTLDGSLFSDSLRVRASNACGEGNIVSILVQPQPCAALFIPNAIVLSGSEENATWQIKGLDQFPKASVQVYNRWGSAIFRSKGPYVPWDGTYQGKMLPVGTYYYVIEGVREKPLTGDITVLH